MMFCWMCKKTDLPNQLKGKVSVMFTEAVNAALNHHWTHNRIKAVVCIQPHYVVFIFWIHFCTEEKIKFQFQRGHRTVSRGHAPAVWSVVVVVDGLFALWPTLLYMSLLSDCAWSGGIGMYWICIYRGTMCLYYRLTMICIWMSQMYHIAPPPPPSVLHWVLWMTTSHYCDR